jgi:hypothetical protein
MLRRSILLACLFMAGCKCSPSITAVSLTNPCEPEGIPFYLPKPLLIVAKNFRNIQERTDGLTDPAPIPNSFDNQAADADVKANITNASGGASAADSAPKGKNGTTNSQGATTERILPGEVANDGLQPNTFYTYHLVFVPDLTQKYGLRIKGGSGEFRAAMNLVNGWMFTGAGQ